MKVQKLTLKESVVAEENGEFKRVFVNEKTYPLFLTNASLKRGKDLGLIESSLFSDLLKLKSLEKFTEGDEVDASALESFDETSMIQVIYLAFIGANKSKKMDFDEFITLYHDGFMDTIKLYVTLITDLVSDGKNNFAEGFMKSTAGLKKK